MAQRYNMYKRNMRTDYKYNYAILVKTVLRVALNDVRDGESLTCSGKSSHNEGAAEANDLSPQDLLVLILLKGAVSSRSEQTFNWAWNRCPIV